MILMITDALLPMQNPIAHGDSECSPSTTATLTLAASAEAQFSIHT
jgi:hypothetical protein